MAEAVAVAVAEIVAVAESETVAEPETVAVAESVGVFGVGRIGPLSGASKLVLLPHEAVSA